MEEQMKPDGTGEAAAARDEEGTAGADAPAPGWPAELPEGARDGPAPAEFVESGGGADLGMTAFPGPTEPGTGGASEPPIEPEAPAQALNPAGGEAAPETSAQAMPGSPAQAVPGVGGAAMPTPQRRRKKTIKPAKQPLIRIKPPSESSLIGNIFGFVVCPAVLIAIFAMGGPTVVWKKISGFVGGIFSSKTEEPAYELRFPDRPARPEQGVPPARE